MFGNGCHNEKEPDERVKWASEVRDEVEAEFIEFGRKVKRLVSESELWIC